MRVSAARVYLSSAVLLSLAISGNPLFAQKNSDPDLQDLSLTDLANTTVTSVSKKAQRLSQVPAAVFVITRDDIKRSGAQYLPEVLRLSPGVQAVRINASNWAVTVRGFAPETIPSVSPETRSAPAFTTLLTPQVPPIISRRYRLTSKVPLPANRCCFTREHKIGEGSSIAAHASYSYSAENAAAYLERRDTVDADFQHRIQVGARNDLLWGVEFKSSADRFTQGLNIAFIPNRFRDNTASGFVQDKISLAPVRSSAHQITSKAHAWIQVVL